MGGGRGRSSALMSLFQSVRSPISSFVNGDFDLTVRLSGMLISVWCGLNLHESMADALPGRCDAQPAKRTTRSLRAPSMAMTRCVRLHEEATVRGRWKADVKEAEPLQAEVAGRAVEVKAHEAEALHADAAGVASATMHDIIKPAQAPVEQSAVEVMPVHHDPRPFLCSVTTPPHLCHTGDVTPGRAGGEPRGGAGRAAGRDAAVPPLFSLL